MTVGKKEKNSLGLEMNPMKSWDIRKEASNFDALFRDLIHEEEELYALTVDDVVSDVSDVSDSESVAETESVSESESIVHNLNMTLTDTADTLVKREEATFINSPNITDPSDLTVTSITKGKKPNMGYIELLFSYKSKSMELYFKQVAWLQNKLDRKDTGISLPEPSFKLEKLNEEIDALSLNLLEAQNNKNMNMTMIIIKKYQ